MCETSRRSPSSRSCRRGSVSERQADERTAATSGRWTYHCRDDNALRRVARSAIAAWSFELQTRRRTGTDEPSRSVADQLGESDCETETVSSSFQARVLPGHEHGVVVACKIASWTRQSACFSMLPHNHSTRHLPTYPPTSRATYHNVCRRPIASPHYCDESFAGAVVLSRSLGSLPNRWNLPGTRTRLKMEEEEEGVRNGGTDRDEFVVSPVCASPHTKGLRGPVVAP